MHVFKERNKESEYNNPDIYNEPAGGIPDFIVKNYVKDDEKNEKDYNDEIVGFKIFYEGFNFFHLPEL